MTSNRSSRLFATALFALAAAAQGGASTALAQGYPTKPIRLAAPSTPGDASDVIARDIAKWKSLTQKVGIKID